MIAHRNIVRMGGAITLHPATKRTGKAPDRLAITTKNRIEIIPIHEILHLRAESNYTHIHLIDGTHFIVCSTLKSFDTVLHSPDFLRIHQSYIIQTKHLKAFNPADSVVHLDGNHILPVSRARKSQLMQYLRTLMISH